MGYCDYFDDDDDEEEEDDDDDGLVWKLGNGP